MEGIFPHRVLGKSKADSYHEVSTQCGLGTQLYVLGCLANIHAKSQTMFGILQKADLVSNREEKHVNRCLQVVKSL